MTLYENLVVGARRVESSKLLPSEPDIHTSRPEMGLLSPIYVGIVRFTKEHKCMFVTLKLNQNLTPKSIRIVNRPFPIMYR